MSGRTVEKLDSPKAQIMALVVDGILTQKLPWGLILIGAFLAIAMEILGIPSLPVAVGVYLPDLDLGDDVHGRRRALARRAAAAARRSALARRRTRDRACSSRPG